MSIATGWLFDMISRYDWNSPVSFLIVLFGVLLVFRQWKLVLIISMTCVLGWYFHDWLVMNMKTLREVVSLPVLIYIGGATVSLITAAYGFLKYMLR